MYCSLQQQSIKSEAYNNNPDSKVHGANMGPTWVLSAPDRPHVGPVNLAIRESNASIPCPLTTTLMMPWTWGPQQYSPSHNFSMETISLYTSNLHMLFKLAAMLLSTQFFYGNNTLYTCNLHISFKMAAMLLFTQFFCGKNCFTLAIFIYCSLQQQIQQSQLNKVIILRKQYFYTPEIYIYFFFQISTMYLFTQFVMKTIPYTPAIFIYCYLQQQPIQLFYGNIFLYTRNLHIFFQIATM